jgi:hypothetical protein
VNQEAEKTKVRWGAIDGVGAVAEPLPRSAGSFSPRQIHMNGPPRTDDRAPGHMWNGLEPNNEFEAPCTFTCEPKPLTM